MRILFRTFSFLLFYIFFLPFIWFFLRCRLFSFLLRFRSFRIMFGLRHKLKFSLFKFVFRLSFMDSFFGVHLFHFVVILLCNFDSILHDVFAPFSLFNSIPIIAIPPHVFPKSSFFFATPRFQTAPAPDKSTQPKLLAPSTIHIQPMPFSSFFFLSAPLPLLSNLFHASLLKIILRVQVTPKQIHFWKPMRTIFIFFDSFMALLCKSFSPLHWMFLFYVTLPVFSSHFHILLPSQPHLQPLNSTTPRIKLQLLHTQMNTPSRRFPKFSRLHQIRFTAAAIPIPHPTDACFFLPAPPIFFQITALFAKNCPPHSSHVKANSIHNLIRMSFHLFYPQFFILYPYSTGPSMDFLR